MLLTDLTAFSPTGKTNISLAVPLRDAILVPNEVVSKITSATFPLAVSK